MRHTLILLSVLAICGLSFGPSFGIGAQAKKQAPDPWVGDYLRFQEYDTHREGQFGQAQRITITKAGDDYVLDKYPNWKFTEIQKGVLQSATFGKVYLGTYQFSDGKVGRLLRADFCYERFIMYGAKDVDSTQPVPK